MTWRTGWPKVIIYLLGPYLASVVTFAGHHDFLIHTGMASASAAVAVGTNYFFAASDEDNRLRLYSITNATPVLDVDVTPWLRLSGGHGEVDLEGAATLGELTFWLGSHGRAKDGRIRRDRERLFATRIITNGNSPQIRVAGQPYTRLLDDLVTAPQLAKFRLAEALDRAPENGGINLEGLAAGPGGNLVIGFRSPVPEGKALLVTLKNPQEIIEGRSAELGESLLLDLGGLGIRDLAWSGREWFCIAGRSSGGGTAKLYRWEPGVQPVRVDHPGFRQLNPEAVTVFGGPEDPRLLILSDDGKRNQSQFRSFWVKP